MAFTRKEEALLHDDYFETIRETEQFVEVKSRNTGHCWNVFKNTIERGCRVTLYHKHKRSDEYYHKHKECRTVAEAMEQIKGHDAYVLEQQALERQRVTQPSKIQGSRKLKVYEGSDSHYNAVAQIRLQGKWLEDLGFEPGTPFIVQCESGKLTLTAM